MTPKRRPKRAAAAAPSSSVAGSSPAAGSLSPADEAEVITQVTQRLRETFRSCTAEEKDVIISSEGLTMRQTLTRDLRLAAMGSPRAPQFGKHYNDETKRIFRKKGNSPHDLIRDNAKVEPGMVANAELMAVTLSPQHK